MKYNSITEPSPLSLKFNFSKKRFHICDAIFKCGNFIRLNGPFRLTLALLYITVYTYTANILHLFIISYPKDIFIVNIYPPHKEFGAKVNPFPFHLFTVMCVHACCVRCLFIYIRKMRNLHFPPAFLIKILYVCLCCVYVHVLLVIIFICVCVVYILYNKINVHKRNTHTRHNE